ncbi:MAG: glucan biosynthesis protein G [Candidatus Omnitrophica bacterium]|nr:glucan biosynthesis protein G [Candidatus Omnitrophota bacterium]
MIFIFFFLMWPTALFASEGKFNLQRVIEQAKRLAAEDFKPEPQIPDFLRNISYDQWRDIRFKDSKTLWQNDREPFKIRFFHLGFYYRQPVMINYVDGRGVHRFRFSPADFDYGKNDFAGKVPTDLGFAGFRIHYPINTPHYADEVAVFLGASYFRAVAKGEDYGLSARGLAVDTATDVGEEFPFFKEFWIIKPSPNDKKITVYALLDSQSMTGAYSFVIHPGRQTIMEVDSHVFFRKKVEILGVGPMTSMFLYGKNSKLEGHEDFRPEVHDSDGLLIHARTGEWIWRPLINPSRLMTNTFDVNTPLGFGLMQRDENFDHYQDLESHFELRPSLWMVPSRNWGEGYVELLQIPSGEEHNDNINVFWVPKDPPKAGETRHFTYALEWGPARYLESSRDYVEATRMMRQDDKVTFIIDFQGRRLKMLPPGKNITADISVAKGGRLLQQQVFKNTVTGGWRLVFQIQLEESFLNDLVPNQKPALGLRAFLKDGSGPLTETWDYAYLP